MKHMRSRQRRGRWFHYYRRRGAETSLGVHGLPPDDPRVMAAYWAEHARQEHSPPDTPQEARGSFAWGLDLYLASPQWAGLSEGTRKSRAAILRKYRDGQGGRPLATITRDDLEAGLYAIGGHAAVNHLKALRPLFRHLHKLRIIPRDPTAGIEIDTPKAGGFPTAGATEIAAFLDRWPVGTTERLAFDLALYTGAARGDLARLSRRNIAGGVLTYTRAKTGIEAHVPLTPQLRAVIARTADIAPAFLLTRHGRPFTAAGLGNFFAEAGRAAGVAFRIHGLRKAFCVYWAEHGRSTHEIAAMAGHTSLSEVQHYTQAADRRRIVGLISGTRPVG